MAATGITVVSRFEGDLLTILQGFLGRLPPSALAALLHRTSARPTCLSRPAVELVQETLAKGATQLIARGGWKQDRFLRAGQMVTGAVWQRTSPRELGLDFSPRTLDFLIWATATAANDSQQLWTPKRKSPRGTLGDSWLLTQAYRAVRGVEAGRLWRQREPWRSDAWCQLHFAVDFSLAAGSPPLDFAPLLTPAGIALLEAGQKELADCWLAMETAKAQVTLPGRLRSMAISQGRVLTPFLAAIDKLGRRDLARFLLDALERLLRPEPTLRMLLPALDVSGQRLADRQQAYRDGLFLLTKCDQLAAWQGEARTVGYFDEGYSAAQLWKADWEAYKGDVMAARARRLLSQAEW